MPQGNILSQIILVVRFHLMFVPGKYTEIGKKIPTIFLVITMQSYQS